MSVSEAAFTLAVSAVVQTDSGGASVGSLSSRQTSEPPNLLLQTNKPTTKSSEQKSKESTEKLKCLTAPSSVFL